MSIHNLYFGAKIRKIVTPRHTPVLLYENGVYGGINYMDLYFSRWLVVYMACIN